VTIMGNFLHQQKTGITFLAGFLLVLALLFKVLAFTDMMQLTLIFSTILAGLPISLRAVQAVRMKTFSIEMLVTIAVIGALFIGEYVESAVVTFLFLFGDYLETRTLEKTRSSLKDLVDMV